MAAAANTFDAIATELLDKKRREGKAEQTIAKVEWLFSLARPAIGARSISELPRRKSWPCCERSKRADGVKPPEGFARPFSRSFAMPWLPDAQKRTQRRTQRRSCDSNRQTSRCHYRAEGLRWAFTRLGRLSGYSRNWRGARIACLDFSSSRRASRGRVDGIRSGRGGLVDTGQKNENEEAASGPTRAPCRRHFTGASNHNRAGKVPISVPPFRLALYEGKHNQRRTSPSRVR